MFLRAYSNASDEHVRFRKAIKMKTPSRNSVIQYQPAFTHKYKKHHNKEISTNIAPQEIEEQTLLTEEDKHIAKRQDDMFAGLQAKRIRSKQLAQLKKENKSGQRIVQQASTHTPHPTKLDDNTQPTPYSLLNNDKELEAIRQVSQQLDDTDEVATLLNKLYTHIEDTPDLAEKAYLKEANKWSNQQKKLERKTNQQLQKINKKWLHIDIQRNKLLKIQAALQPETTKSSWLHAIKRFIALHTLLGENKIDSLAEKKNILETKATTLRAIAQQKMAYYAAQGTYKAEAEMYFTAYRQAKKIQHMAEEAAAKITAQPATHLSQPDNPLHDDIATLAILFRAQKNLYKGAASEADLNAHALYEQHHLLKVFGNNMVSGDRVAETETYSAQLGIAAPLAPPVDAWAGVHGEIGFIKSTYLNHDRDLNYIEQWHGGLGLQARANFKPIGSAGLGLGTRLTLRGDYFQTAGDDKGRDAVAKYSLIMKNNWRWMPETLLARPLTRVIYRRIQRAFNWLHRLEGYTPANTNKPIYATTRTLEKAQSAKPILAAKYADLAQRLQQRPSNTQIELPTVDLSAALSFDSTRSLTLSVPAVASKNHSPKKREAPWRIIKGTLAGDIQAGSASLHHGLAEDVQKFSGLMPSASANAYASAEITSSTLHLALLRPPHELLSTEQTYSYETSRALAQDIIASVWKSASTASGTALPAHLQATDALMAKIEQPLTADVLDHLRTTTQVLHQLACDFSEFEKVGSQFTAATKLDLGQPFFLKEYQKLSKAMRRYQLAKNYLITTKPLRYKKAQKEVANIYAHFSEALGMIKLAALGRLQREGDIHNAALNDALTLFQNEYDALAKKLARPDLPLTQDALYRYGALEVPHKIKQVYGELSAGAGIGIAAPLPLREFYPDITVTPLGITAPFTKPNKNDHTSTDFLGIGKDIKMTWKKVSQHPDPLLQGFFKTSSHRVVINTAGLGDWLSAKNLSLVNHSSIGGKLSKQALANTMHDMDRPTAKALNMQVIANALHLVRGSVGTTWTTVYREDELQYTAVARANEKSTYNYSPNLAQAIGAKLTVGYATSETSTKTINMMGPDLAYHALQFAALAEHGIDETQIGKIQSAMHLANPLRSHELNFLLQPLFTKATDNATVLLNYFGLNGIGGLLQKFSQESLTAPVSKKTNGHFQLANSMALFHQDVVDIYQQRQTAARSMSSRQFSANTAPLGNIFSEISATQLQVKKLLAQTMSMAATNTSPSTQTITDFLAQATPIERLHFFESTSQGKELFAYYLLLVSQAQKTKVLLAEGPIRISPMLRKTDEKHKKSF